MSKLLRKGQRPFYRGLCCGNIGGQAPPGSQRDNGLCEGEVAVVSSDEDIPDNKRTKSAASEQTTQKSLFCCACWFLLVRYLEIKVYNDLQTPLARQVLSADLLQGRRNDNTRGPRQCNTKKLAEISMDVKSPRWIQHAGEIDRGGCKTGMI